MNSNTSFGRGNTSVRLSAAIVCKTLAAHNYNINDVVDVGCGDGTWLSQFNGKRTGLDRKRHILPDSMDWFHAVDFEGAYTIPNRPLALCLEVAEHLTPQAGVRLVYNLCKSATTIVWSAAVPGQGGFGHINEQWPSYWAEEFDYYGFRPCVSVRNALWANNEILPWYHNIIVYSASDAPSCELLDIVHPSLYNHRSLSRLCSLILPRG